MNHTKEPCPYCMRVNGESLVEGEYGLDVWIRGDKLVAVTCDYFKGGQLDCTKINYCPMCGRKLEDV